VNAQVGQVPDIDRPVIVAVQRPSPNVNLFPAIDPVPPVPALRLLQSKCTWQPSW
jgi:hypothetical protein